MKIFYLLLHLGCIQDVTVCIKFVEKCRVCREFVECLYFTKFHKLSANAHEYYSWCICIYVSSNNVCNFMTPVL